MSKEEQKTQNSCLVFGDLRNIFLFCLFFFSFDPIANIICRSPNSHEDKPKAVLLGLYFPVQGPPATCFIVTLSHGNVAVRMKREMKIVK